MLEREEFIEQAYLYRILAERLGQSLTIQDLLEQCRYEVLATTKLPMAIEFLCTELKHSGIMAEGMRRLSHYFTSFQSFVIEQAELDIGKFDFRTALNVLRFEAEYRSKEANPQGIFFYQFETLCRNRLNYDRGLKAMSEDRAYNQAWCEWLLIVRSQLGIVEISDLIYGRSEAFVKYRKRHLGEDAEADYPILFGDREGRIAFANRRKEPLFLFAAMQRHLGYPPVPKREVHDDSIEQLPQMHRRLERLEARVKFLEEEQRQGIDITKFYAGRDKMPPVDLNGPT
jgi:hypothetical protein